METALVRDVHSVDGCCCAPVKFFSLRLCCPLHNVHGQGRIGSGHSGAACEGPRMETHSFTWSVAQVGRPAVLISLLTRAQFLSYVESAE
jgi:hypothetical protein